MTISWLSALPSSPGRRLPPIDYAAIAPLLIVLGAACVAVLVEAFLPRHQRWPAQVGALASSRSAAPGSRSACTPASGPDGVTTIADALAVDRPTLFLWGTLLALGLGSVLLIADRSVEPGGAFVASAAPRAAAGGRHAAASPDAPGGPLLRLARARRRRCRPRSSRSRCSRSAG